MKLKGYKVKDKKIYLLIPDVGDSETKIREVRRLLGQVIEWRNPAPTILRAPELDEMES